MNLSDADEYCRRKAAPAGGSFYYSILFYPENLRRDLRALHALGIELEDILSECSDTGVMRMKFAWWQEEILRLYQGAARHPVTRSLVNVIGRHDIRQDQLLDLIHHMEQLSTLPRIPGGQQPSAPFADGPGQVWGLSARICGHQAPETPAHAVEMGSLFFLFHKLRHTAGAVTAPAAQGMPGERRRLLDDIRESLTHHCAVFPETDRRRQLHILIMAHIIGRSCEAILRNDKFQALTPIRKLWLAWRLHRRYL